MLNYQLAQNRPSRSRPTEDGRRPLYRVVDIVAFLTVCLLFGLVVVS